MKTSVMDNIRILRSSRRKTDPKKGRAPNPSPAVAPAQAPKPAPSEATQQWVPVLVLDISQTSASPVTTTTIPVAYSSNSSVQSVAQSKHILLEKTVPVSTVTPCPGDVPVSHSNIIVRCNSADPKPSHISSIEPVVEPATQGPSNTADTESSEQSEKADQEASDSHVRCVLCDKSFPSLNDMQTHYLSTHKSRRGKDNRKAKANSDNLPTQTEIDGEQSGPDQSEPPLPIGDKGEVDPKCPVCSLDFTTADEVKKHMKEVHSYICSECNSTFYSLFQFTNHKCTKIPKKLKRVRKKVPGNVVSTKLPLKPEVAKIMNSFVQIQPKAKKSNKLSARKTQKSPTPPVLEKVQQPFSVIALVSDAKQMHATEMADEKSVPPCNKTTSAALEVAEEPPLLEAVTERKEDVFEEEVPNFLPAIETAYSLKPSTDCKSEVQKCTHQIPVIETRNIEQAKYQFLRKTESPDPVVPKGEVILQKIAQLKRNPHVSLSWRPTLQARKQVEENEEYVCGRCNVLCDDMEDYMDHLQDCLTMSSVTLEPVATPPRRLLKLPCQTAAFGTRDTGYNRYLINQNLMAKLKAYLPPPVPPVSHPSPHHFKPPITAPLSSGHTFRDLLDDDFGYESHESVDMQTAGSGSPVSPATRHSEASHSSAVQGRACTGSTSRGTAQPMVMIPMDSKINLGVIPDHQPLKKLSGHATGGEEATESDGCPGLAASPLGLLLDQDDIKMEVEEEVVEDHFEVR